MNKASKKNRASKRDTIVIDDDDSISQQPVAKNAKIEEEPVPSPEVNELEQKNLKLEKDYQHSNLHARGLKERVDFLENLIGSKHDVNKAADKDKTKVEELEKKMAEISLELEEAKRNAENSSTANSELVKDNGSLKMEMAAMKEEHEKCRAKDRKRIEELTKKLDEIIWRTKWVKTSDDVTIEREDAEFNTFWQIIRDRYLSLNPSANEKKAKEAMSRNWPIMTPFQKNFFMTEAVKNTPDETVLGKAMFERFVKHDTPKNDARLLWSSRKARTITNEDSLAIVDYFLKKDPRFPLFSDFVNPTTDSDPEKIEELNSKKECLLNKVNIMHGKELTLGMLNRHLNHLNTCILEGAVKKGRPMPYFESMYKLVKAMEKKDPPPKSQSSSVPLRAKVNTNHSANSNTEQNQLTLLESLNELIKAATAKDDQSEVNSTFDASVPTEENSTETPNLELNPEN